MKLVSKLLVVIGVLVFSAEAGRATDVDGLALMKVEPAARAAGMGGAFVSIGGDPNSSAYNPAGAINSSEFVASFGHNQYWENARIETGYFAMRFSPRVFAHAGVRFASIGDIQSRQIPSATPDDVFQANDVSAKVGLTYKVLPRVAVGASLGWFFEKIYVYRGSAFNLDLGALATLPNQITVGAAVQNIGAKFRLQNAGEEGSGDITLPLTYRLGANYKYRDYLGAIDLVVLDSKAHVHVGAEANIHENLKLRSGYMFGYDSKNFTAGASFIYRNITFDYAFVPYTNSLGTTHVFNLTFRV